MQRSGNSIGTFEPFFRRARASANPAGSKNARAMRDGVLKLGRRRGRDSKAEALVVPIVKTLLTGILLPVGVTDAGEKLQVKSTGNEEAGQLKLIAWLKPPTGVALMVVVPLAPRAIVSDVGLTA